jgi:hypothetical protein
MGRRQHLGRVVDADDARFWPALSQAEREGSVAAPEVDHEGGLAGSDPAQQVVERACPVVGELGVLLRVPPGAHGFPFHPDGPIVTPLLS